MLNSKIIALKATVQILTGRRGRVVWNPDFGTEGKKIRRITYLFGIECLYLDSLKDVFSSSPEDVSSGLDVYNAGDTTPGIIVAPTEVTFPGGGAGVSHPLGWLGWTLQRGQYDFDNLYLSGKCTFCAQITFPPKYEQVDKTELTFYPTVLIEWE